MLETQELLIRIQNKIQISKQDKYTPILINCCFYKRVTFNNFYPIEIMNIYMLIKNDNYEKL